MEWRADGKRGSCCGEEGGFPFLRWVMFYLGRFFTFFCFFEFFISFLRIVLCLCFFKEQENTQIRYILLCLWFKGNRISEIRYIKTQREKEE